MFKKILVPVDGSAFGESALPMALMLSRQGDADMRLAMVNEPAGATGAWGEAFRSAHTAYLQRLEERVSERAPHPVSTVLLDGDVADALCQEAAHWDADLILMSTHGRGGLTRWWLGSVADAVIRQFATPVLLVRPPEGVEPSQEFDDPAIRRVVVPLDGSRLSETAIPPALALAGLLGASVELLRVIAYPVVVNSYLPHTVLTNRSYMEEVGEGAWSYLKRVRTDIDDGSLRIDINVVVNQHAARGVLDHVATNGSDLVSMATHGRSPAARVLLGSTADKVIRGAHSPILVVRPVEERAVGVTESVA